MRDGTGKLPTPDSHVDNEYDTKTMVYNRKSDEKKGKRYWSIVLKRKSYACTSTKSILDCAIIV